MFNDNNASLNADVPLDTAAESVTPTALDEASSNSIVFSPHPRKPDLITS